MPAAVFHGSDAYPATGPDPVVTVGNFDGVHLGHRALIARTVAQAATRGAPACAYTFHPAPRDVLRPDNDVPRIQSLSDKLEVLAEVGVDHVVVEPFDHAFAAHTGDWFAREVIRGRLRAAALVLGWDFRFGRGRAAQVSDMAAWLDVPVTQVEAVELDGVIVSSSRIRQLVRDGDVVEAARLLARPHRVRGTVRPGAGRGRTLGFATANVATETPLLPATGVYAVTADLGDGRRHAAVANLGRRPTFGGTDVVLEVHLLDFSEDLYGRPLAVDFMARIRAEQRFDGPDALAARIAEDVRLARAVLQA